ncbi:MAG TPA: class I SAM-dependent methyltransferase [Solirubrobacteraceae bacterium]|nr:class I SAM-dependent methyltransferase [Solirubrobacteraceae bacterium]
MAGRIVDEPMRAYYDRRAAEYDDWWLGTGLFAARDRPGWCEEVEALAGVLRALPPARVLDVACGTGFLTRHLRGDVIALDQSRRMLAIAAARMPGAAVVRGDAVPLPFPDGAVDRVLTSHFYGHLLPAERARFLAEARRVGGELVVVDSARRDGAGAEEWQERVLNDGSRHRVYKRFFTGAGLAAELGGGEVLHEGRWFVVVRAATPASARP